MKKKIISAILVTSLVLGVGTMAYVGYAQTNSTFSSNPNQVINRNIGENVESQKVNFEEAQKIMEQQGVNVEQAQNIMADQGIDIDEMYEVMTEGNFDNMRDYMNRQNVDFGKMQQYMNEVNPNRSPQGNFQGMRNFR